MFDHATVAKTLNGAVPRHFTIFRPSLTRDSDIAAVARDRLESSSYRGVRSLSCEFDGSVLVLRGRVSSYHQKQLAQEAVRGITGVRKVNNSVQVVVPNST